MAPDSNRGADEITAADSIARKNTLSQPLLQSWLHSTRDTLDIKCAAGWADFRFHNLRHEAVSRFVVSGLSNQLGSAIRGHKSMQMRKRHTHLCTEDLVAKPDKSNAQRCLAHRFTSSARPAVTAV